MNDCKSKEIIEKKDQEIVFTKAVKAGKRIYYMDVKRNRKNELFLAITESKKNITASTNGQQVTFEKHKIFLYKADFERFMEGLRESITFIDNIEDCGKKMPQEGALLESLQVEIADF